MHSAMLIMLVTGASRSRDRISDELRAYTMNLMQIFSNLQDKAF
jgi:hypothetical protein